MQALVKSLSPTDSCGVEMRDLLNPLSLLKKTKIDFLMPVSGQYRLDGV